ncbi:CAT RNA binding domain-containing protein [Lactobacillus delbrueckii]|uniref:CAT RNA binding domain-containing protein n=1 Tax=Lactobacillus delbrueckii TaxID=1584 RepID=UPI003A8485F3
MVIKKVLNNGAVLTTNQDGEEIIVLGKGIAFMLISQDFTTQCLKSLLLRPFSKFKIIFFEL